uniref:serine--tRNA ligase n=1 Tax=uncultured Planktosalinus sp. TaxID=1810935 RepID=UPI0030DAE2A9
MLQVTDIRDNKDAFITALKKRNIDATPLFEEVLQTDELRRSTQAKLDNILAESNKISKEIGILFKNGDSQKANALKEKTTQYKEETKTLQEELNAAVEQLQQLLYNIPNIPNDLVPAGSSEDDNEEVFRAGEIPKLADDALPHWKLAKKYDIIDFELGNKVTGAGFPVYKGKGARLQRALISYFLDKNTAAGYTEYQVPLMVNEASGFGTGQLPDKEGQMYHVTEDNLYLIPTAEVPVTNMFRDEILQAKELPILCTGYTPCFRREAGSYGAHVRGLNRLHQFDKVEIVRIEHPSNSHNALDGMVEHVKEILN